MGKRPGLAVGRMMSWNAYRRFVSMILRWFFKQFTTWFRSKNDDGKNSAIIQNCCANFDASCQTSHDLEQYPMARHAEGLQWTSLRHSTLLDACRWDTSWWSLVFLRSLWTLGSGAWAWCCAIPHLTNMLGRLFRAPPGFRRVVPSAYWRCWLPLAIFFTNWRPPSYSLLHMQTIGAGFHRNKGYILLRFSRRKTRWICWDCNWTQKRAGIGPPRNNSDRRALKASLQRKAMLIQTLATGIVYGGHNNLHRSAAFCRLALGSSPCVGGLLAYIFAVLGMSITLQTCLWLLSLCAVYVRAYNRTLCQFALGRGTPDCSICNGISRVKTIRSCVSTQVLFAAHGLEAPFGWYN